MCTVSSACGVCVCVGGRPDVVSSAIRSTVSDDAGVPLTQWSVALTAEEAGHVPVQIWGHIQSEVIINILLTAMAHLLVPCHWGIWRERERVCQRGRGRESRGCSGACPLLRRHLRPCPLHAHDVVAYTNDNVDWSVPHTNRSTTGTALRSPASSSEVLQQTPDTHPFTDSGYSSSRVTYSSEDGAHPRPCSWHSCSPWRRALSQTRCRSSARRSHGSHSPEREREGGESGERERSGVSYSQSQLSFMGCSPWSACAQRLKLIECY